MNQANVDALARLLEEAQREVDWAWPHPQYLAEFLASRGVLVPSVLTVQEVADLYDVPAKEEFRQSRIEDLEWTARGQD